MTSIYKHSLVAFAIILILYLIVFLFADINNYDLVIWQFFTSISFLACFRLGLNLKTKGVFILIFIYQILFSYILFSIYLINLNTPFGYNAVDSILYSDLAQHIKHLSLKESYLYLYHYFNEGLSDLGFPILLKYIYQLSDGNILTSFTLLIFINCIFQLFTVIITYKISLPLLGKNGSKCVILLWGTNTASVFLNVSGLKEPIFLFLCMCTMLYMYKINQNCTLLNILSATFFIITLYFFRSYVSIFFFLLLLGLLFRYLYEKLFLTICILSITICISFTEILESYLPEIYYAMMRTEEMHTTSGPLFKYISYILAILSPIPKFFEIETAQNLIMLSYSVVKFFFSIYAMFGIWYILKEKKTDYYPLVLIVLFQILLLIVSGRIIDYRYTYVTMPCFYILMVKGFPYKNKLINTLYIVFSISVILIFNLRAY